MSETIAELESDPDVAYAVPNWRAHAAAAVTSDPGSRRQWNLFGDFGINRSRHGPSLIRGAPGGRGAVVAVLDAAWPTRAAGATGAPRSTQVDLRQALRLHRRRPSSQRLLRSRHPRVEDDRPDHQQRCGHGRDRLQREDHALRVLDARVRVIQPRSHGDPICRPPRGGRDQPVARVPGAGARRGDPGRDQVAALRPREGCGGGGGSRQPGRLRSGLPRASRR